MIKFCNRIIKYSFYALFLFVPLVFTSATSELFELNKMWLTWGLTIIIATSWLIKMILQKKILFRRTPLDIPIGLFLVSQIISTIFSMDPHVSLWGYYSRFNGGLLSIISYILLYYAFLSNFNSQKLSAITHKLLAISLFSGLIVALWGLPSHFGYDPTCLIFRGTFDVSCWTADFLPKVRIFSTMGQPDWLAAYLAILIPITIAFLLKNSKSEVPNPKQSQNSNFQITKTFLNFGNWNLFRISIFGLLILFYVDLLFTRARSGFLGMWISLIFFIILYFWANIKTLASVREKLKFPPAILVIVFLAITFFVGTPIGQLQRFTLEGIGKYFQRAQTSKIQTQSNESGGPARNASQRDAGGTESGKIRLFVWEGAINAWKNNPIFGTGVETFAFAYYKYKPIGQNLTSEWNFLYNKAHNEYLNYLATTGIIGLGAYLSMIFVFLWLCARYFTSSIKEKTHNANHLTLIMTLVTSYISILVINFFGFSVVITNIYLFIIPAFVFVLAEILPKNESEIENCEPSNPYQWTAIFFILLASLFMILGLFRFWQADVSFAHGNNLNRAKEYQQAYLSLHKAIELRGDEPVFKDELSINNAIIALGLAYQESQDEKAKEQAISAASSLAQKAIDTSNEVLSQNPNNATFWKTRTRVFYTLSQIDPRYLPRSLDAIEKASLLAPNDANIWYNLGVLYGQNNNIPKGIETLEKTIMLKPNYRDARYALGLFYHTASLDKSGKIVADENLNKKALDQMQFILKYISPKDAEALSSLQNWAK